MKRVVLIPANNEEASIGLVLDDIPKSIIDSIIVVDNASIDRTKEVAEGSRLAYIETYGCQMNFSDTEIIASVLTEMDYGFTTEIEEADLIFLNTCSIRENAETKIWNRLRNFRKKKEEKPEEGKDDE